MTSPRFFDSLQSYDTSCYPRSLHTLLRMSLHSSRWNRSTSVRLGPWTTSEGRGSLYLGRNDTGTVLSGTTQVRLLDSYLFRSPSSHRSFTRQPDDGPDLSPTLFLILLHEVNQSSLTGCCKTFYESSKYFSNCVY